MYEYKCIHTHTYLYLYAYICMYMHVHATLTSDGLPHPLSSSLGIKRAKGNILTILKSIEV